MGFLERAAPYNRQIEALCDTVHAQKALDREPTKTQA